MGRKEFRLKSLEAKLGSMTVGGFLRSWRLSEGMSQQSFAKKLKVSSANLCDIEKGRKGVSPEKAEEIAGLIGYSPLVLIELALRDQLRMAGMAYEVEIRPKARKAV